MIISPNFPILEDWARANDLKFSSREELVTNPTVKALYEGIVGELNQTLARHETLKRVLLVPEEFTPNDGTLTPTMKLRRRSLSNAIESRSVTYTRKQKFPLGEGKSLSSTGPDDWFFERPIKGMALGVRIAREERWSLGTRIASHCLAKRPKK